MHIQTAEKIVSNELEAVSVDPAIVGANGCAACHILFRLADQMNISEADAAELLSEILLQSPELDDRFIDVVETVHMKHRMAGGSFVIKTRSAKNRYIDSQLKNSLEEILSDAANFGVETAMRKLFLTHAALQIAQNLGVDYHAATEELYHCMRRQRQSEQELENLITSFLGRARK